MRRRRGRAARQDEAADGDTRTGEAEDAARLVRLGESTLNRERPHDNPSGPSSPLAGGIGASSDPEPSGPSGPPGPAFDFIGFSGATWAFSHPGTPTFASGLRAVGPRSRPGILGRGPGLLGISGPKFSFVFSSGAGWTGWPDALGHRLERVGSAPTRLRTCAGCSPALYCCESRIARCGPCRWQSF
jgi:hypothetical protein